MADLDNQTLFGEEVSDEMVAWPAGYGSCRQLIERTLFGEIARWRTVPWPEGYGHA
jgi:hypothetical protein